MFKIAFTGHRPQKLNGKTEGVKHALYHFLATQKHEKEKLIVISGGALGVDQYAAEIARELNIPYVMILPFPVAVMSKKWNDESKEHLKDLIKDAVKTYVIQKTFSFEGYQRRNEAMVDHCDLLCAVWNGSNGGTKNCIDYAKEVGRQTTYLEIAKETEEINFYGYKGDYGWLSNFHLSPQTVEGVTYKSNEHYYQSQKAKTHKDAKKIADARSPFESKKIAYTIQNREDWHEIKEGVMLQGLRAKFANPELKEKLINTGTATLHENSPTDLVWGKHGKDLLGKLLMQIRQEIAK